MTWQVAAVRYVSIGEQSARFRDLTLPFAVDGEPVESVIWLPNGGGKSSLMSLKSAVVLPAARDFTGAGREDGEKRPRRLEDYVGTGDTSHTVISWSAEDPASLFGERHELLTGAVYEWPDRRHPAREGEARLTKLWWSAVPLPGVLDLETLPVRDGRLLTMGQFRDKMRHLNTEHPELQIQIVTGTQSTWEQQLGALGIDTALYRYQARMNTSEGGIAKVFRFASVRDFIDLVVDVIAHPGQADDCSAVLAEHAKNLFRRPGLLTEREFLTESHTLLGVVDLANSDVESARGRRSVAGRRAVRLRAALTLAAGQLDARVEQAGRKVDELTGRTTDTRRERGRLEGIRGELAHRAAAARHQDAVAALGDAERVEGESRLGLATWSAAASLAEALGYDAAAAELREQLRPEREARETLRRRHDTVATAARGLLAEEAARLDVTAEAFREDVRAVGRRQLAIDELVAGHRREVAAAGRTAAAAEAMIDAHEQALAGAVRSGMLLPDEDPAAAVARHGRLREEENTLAVQATVQAAEVAEQVKAVFRDARQAASDQTGLKRDAEDAHTEERALVERHGRIAGDPRLVALAEADGSVDVWGDAGQLRSALAEAIRDAQERSLAEAVESAEDDRLVAAVDAGGLLPAPLPTGAAADTLAVAGVAAEVAWQVLARDYGEDARAAAAQRRPDVVSGVVVQDETALERAVALLASSPTLAHVPLVTVAQLAATAVGSADEATLPSVPLHRGLHDTAAAAVAAQGLRSAGEARRERRARFTARAESDQRLLDQLGAFLAEHPDRECLRRAAAATGAARTATAAGAQRIAALADEQERLQDLASERTAEARQHERRAEEHRRHAQDAQQLATASAQTDGHRAVVEDAETKVAAQTAAIETLENEQRVLRARLPGVVADQRSAELGAEAARQQARQTALVGDPADLDPEEIARDAAQGLTSCLGRFGTLSEEWRAAASQSVLEERLTSTETRARDARSRADRVVAGFDGPRPALRELAEQRASENSPAACEELAAAAGKAVNAALVATTETRAEVKRCAARLRDAEPRDGRRFTAEPVTFTTAETAEAEVERLTAEVGRLTSRESALTNERVDVETAAAEQRATADSLRDLTDRLPHGAGTEAPGEDNGDAAPFEGDLAQARIEVSAAATEIGESDTHLSSAREALADLAREALQLASRPAFAGLTLAVRERLVDGDPTALGAKAGGYAAEIEIRLGQLSELFEQVGQDEVRITTLVASHVRQLLSGISGAARASALPPGLGELSGQQFISLRYTNPTDEELTSRVGQEVLAMLDGANGDLKNLPGGESVLRRCVHASVGVKGFRAEVLKPNEHMLAQRVPVVDVALFSDGEKLTTCVLLFCAFARMRQRGSTGPGATGTLMLDNPFGRASTAQLVALQLAVARAQRVHLVYATGLEDMGALLQFRNLIRLRNRRPVGSTDGHVQHEAGAARHGEVSGVSVTRPDAPTPPGVGSVRLAAVGDGERPDGDEQAAAS